MPLISFQDDIIRALIGRLGRHTPKARACASQHRRRVLKSHRKPIELDEVANL